MTKIPSDVILTFQCDQISIDQWRRVIAACQSYEQLLIEGGTTTVDDFANQFPDLGKEILMPELEKVKTELQEDPDALDRLSQKRHNPTERYVILEEIRSGGMGQVFRAFDRICGRLVAIKRIRSEFAQDLRMRQRFLSEVELTADLEHPGVIPIYDQSIDPDGREIYVMRLIHGEETGTLQQAISKFHDVKENSQRQSKRFWSADKRRDFRRLIESVHVITDTTAHAHSRNIAHRDLKPSNILVGPFGETLIADWGLAKRINKPGSRINCDDTIQPPNTSVDGNDFIRSSHDQGIGTPGFRAPEMLSTSTTVNLFAADIYSLGAILFCVTTGSAPLSLKSESRKLDFSCPASLRPLIAISQKAMSPDARNRYQNAQLMAVDLSNWLAGEPVSAYPESLAERIWKWPSRNRLVASAIAGATLISLIASGLFAWYQTVQMERLGEALQTASILLDENQRGKRSIEESFAQRESLTLHAIVEFQSLLTLNPLLQSDPQFRVVREKVLLESRGFYNSLAKSFDQSAKIDDDSLGRLTDAGLALVLLEHELGNVSEALRVAESALERLRRVEHRSQPLEYHLGRLLAFKGNIATRAGRKQQGLADQEQAVGHLEPLLDSAELSQEDRSKAVSLWSRAASPMALGIAAKGEFKTALDLLHKILQRLNANESESFQDALLKIQSYGNLAMVRYFSKDTQGTYEALEHAQAAVKRCESLMDGGVPFREVIEFEVMRGTLFRFKSDLMLTEGKTWPAIEMLSQSLMQLAGALAKHPVNADIQSAYHSCSSRLQTVFLEQGIVEQAKKVALEELDLARKIQRADESDPKMLEYLMLAYHSMGHLNEKTKQMSEAEQNYGDALAIANRLLGSGLASEGLYSHVIELNLHMVRCEVLTGRIQAAQMHFEAAIESACELKELPEGKHLYHSSIHRQLEAAVLTLQETDFKESKEAWMHKLRTSGLLP